MTFWVLNSGLELRVRLSPPSISPPPRGVVQVNLPKNRGTLRQMIGGPPSPSGWAAFRRLQVVGIVVPVVFFVALEAVVLLAARHYEPTAWLDVFATSALGIITVLAIVGFSTLMFRYIKLAHEEVVLQSSELAAINAVSVAVRDEQGVDRILRAARLALLQVDRVEDVSFVISPIEDQRAIEIGDEPTKSEPKSEPEGGLIQVAEVILSTGPATFGYLRVSMDNTRDPLPLSKEALASIGQELTFALQSAHVIADLRRGEHENKVLLDILLQVSRQAPTAEILDQITYSARDLVNGDTATLTVVREVIQNLSSSSSEANLPLTFWAESGSPGDLAPSATAAQLRTAVVSLPIRGKDGLLGELSIEHKARVPLSVRDHGFLEALADISAAALTSAQLRAELEREAIVDERRRIAREMHDSLAQCLAFTHLGLRRLQSCPEVGTSTYLPAELNRLADVCADAYRDVREAILGLNGTPGIAPTLIESLSVYVQKYSEQSGIDTSLEVILNYDLDLSPYSELHLIRVVQEALTNVRKHSGAKSAVVRITAQPSATIIEIKDDGVGFETRALKSSRDGFGLKTMRERIELLGGRLKIDSTPGQGTTVTAQIPGIPQAASLADGLAVAQIIEVR